MPIYDYRSPTPALRDYVKRYQILGCDFPASMIELPVKAYWPRAEHCLTFLPKDPERIGTGFSGDLVESPRSRVQGQYTMAKNIHVGRNFMVINVVFQPGALYRLTGIPLYELTNQFVDAESIFGKEIRLVNEHLSYTDNYIQMVEIIERFLMLGVSRAKKQLLLIDKANLYLQANPATTSLTWLADQACLSQRQFSRQFVQREGINPKLYARIARSENAMKVKNRYPKKRLVRYSYCPGLWYDYQHLVKDFKDFTTITPNEFFKVSGKGPERAYGISETL